VIKKLNLESNATFVKRKFIYLGCWLVVTFCALIVVQKKRDSIIVRNVKKIFTL